LQREADRTSYAVNIINDKDCKIKIAEVEIQMIWESYFDDLLNEENARKPLKQVDST
jgi:hypothetical protein